VSPDEEHHDPTNKAPTLRAHVKRWLSSEVALSALVFGWPFVYLCHYLVPIRRIYAGIGNDFQSLYYFYKLHLIANLAAGYFPLWSPSEAGGFPFYSSPFAQAFYPLNGLLLAWYKIVGGYGRYEHQIFTILGIAIFALGLFRWLRAMGFAVRAALLSALVMGVCFKLTEILRFPNAVHTACWYPWVLLVIHRIAGATTKAECVKGGACLTALLICLCTGGYPYYLYYALFLFGPYSALLLVPRLRKTCFGREPATLRLALPTLCIFTSLAGALCAPYLLKITGLMAQTTDRTGADYGYSTSHLFNVWDTIGSLVYPPTSQTEGWYFFGITMVVIIGLFLVECVGPVREGGEFPARRQRLCVLLLVGWIAAVSYITYGRESYLFDLLWHTLPGFSSLRVWGRMNIILIPILCWLLALAYTSFEARLQRGASLKQVGCVYAVVLAVQLGLYLTGQEDYYWKNYMTNRHGWELSFILFGSAGVAAILGALALGRREIGKHPRFLAGVLAILVAVTAVEMHPVGAYTWAASGSPVFAATKIDMDEFYMASLRQPRTDTYATVPLTPAFNVGTVENWYFERYTQFRASAEGDREARDQLMGVTDGTRLFFSSSIAHATAREFLEDSSRVSAALRVTNYSVNEMHLEVETETAGYLTFVDNWDPDWRVRVNGHDRELERLLGTFKSVQLSPGKHTVVFRYSPGLFR
jgi:hypothetical protein